MLKQYFLYLFINYNNNIKDIAMIRIQLTVLLLSHIIYGDNYYEKYRKYIHASLQNRNS